MTDYEDLLKKQGLTPDHLPVIYDPNTWGEHLMRRFNERFGWTTFLDSTAP